MKDTRSPLQGPTSCFRGAFRYAASPLIVIAGLLAREPTALAVDAVARDAPHPSAPATSAPLPGVTPSMGTTISDTGGCIAKTDQFTPTDYASAEIAAHAACLDTLIPKRIVPVLQTPGSFFIGVAINKSPQFVYGPQVGAGVALLFPLHRPVLTPSAFSAVPGAPVPVGSTFAFELPSAMTFASSLAVSLTANFAAFTFPNAPTTFAATGTTQTGFNAGFYVAPQFGWEWWDKVTHKTSSVMFSLGFMAGYIRTDATGGALALGVQPALAAQF